MRNELVSTFTDDSFGNYGWNKEIKKFFSNIFLKPNAHLNWEWVMKGYKILNLAHMPFALIMIWKYWILSNMEHLNLSVYSDIVYLFTIPLQSQTCSCTWTFVTYLPTIQNNFFKQSSAKRNKFGLIHKERSFVQVITGHSIQYV